MSYVQKEFAPRTLHFRKGSVQFSPRCQCEDIGKSETWLYIQTYFCTYIIVVEAKTSQVSSINLRSHLPVLCQICYSAWQFPLIATLIHAVSDDAKRKPRISAAVSCCAHITAKTDRLSPGSASSSVVQYIAAFQQKDEAADAARQPPP